MVSLGFFREQPIGTVLSGLVPAQIREFRPTIAFCVCSLTLICSVLLGGGTRGGFLSDALLELMAVPALVISLSLLVDRPIGQTKTRIDVHWVLAFCFALAFLPLIQLVPLPPWVWTRLPGREEMAEVFDLLGSRTPWMPVSVSPHATWLSWLSLLPPMAIFLAAIQLGYRERRTLSLVVIAVGVVSAFLGLIQVAQGPTSALRFFAFTNNTEAVGFFANRNHFAALLYVVLLFAAAWAIDVAFKNVSWNEIKRGAALPIMAVTSSFIILIVLIVAETVARSRAGLTVTIVALAAVFALVFTDRRNGVGFAPSKFLLAAILLAVILTVQFALYRILDRFAADPLEDARILFAHNTFRAALAFMPFGAGLGTFVPVYAMFEPPSDLVASVYANHAHNDVLELWLETGVIGVILMAVFTVWVGFTAWKLWRRPPAYASALDCSLARAATVAIGLLMAHSFVDYPLRTEAMMGVVAFCCALMIEPFYNSAAAASVAREPRHVGGPLKQPMLPVNTTAAPGSAPRSRPASAAGADESAKPRQLGRWGEDIEWPQEWNGTETNPSTSIAENDKKEQ